MLDDEYRMNWNKHAFAISGIFFYKISCLCLFASSWDNYLSEQMIKFGQQQNKRTSDKIPSIM